MMLLSTSGATLLARIALLLVTLAGCTSEPPQVDSAGAPIETGDAPAEDAGSEDAPEPAAEDSGPEVPNQPPSAADDDAEAWFGSTIVIRALYNDSDPDGDVIAIMDATEPKHGTAKVVYGGLQLEYTPDGGDYEGPDSFDYTIADGRGGTATATVWVDLVWAPVLTIVKPADGSVTGAAVTVSFEVSGCNFVPPSQDSEGCHGHKFLDGKKWTTPDGKGFGQYVYEPFALSSLSKGPHTFTFVLAKNDGTDGPWSPPVEDTVTFEVK